MIHRTRLMNVRLIVSVRTSNDTVSLLQTLYWIENRVSIDFLIINFAINENRQVSEGSMSEVGVCALWYGVSGNHNRRSQTTSMEEIKRHNLSVFLHANEATKHIQSFCDTQPYIKRRCTASIKYATAVGVVQRAIKPTSPITIQIAIAASELTIKFRKNQTKPKMKRSFPCLALWKMV